MQRALEATWHAIWKICLFLWYDLGPPLLVFVLFCVAVVFAVGVIARWLFHDASKASQAGAQGGQVLPHQPAGPAGTA